MPLSSKRNMFMFSLWHFLSLIALVYCQARDVTDLFQVDFTTANTGGCGPVGKDTLQRMLNEAVVLAEAGVRVIDDFGSSPEAKRLLDSFLRGGGDSDRSEMKAKYQIVGGFLANNANIPPGGKPFLFCSDNWLERRTMDSPALDINGNEFPKPDLSGLPAQLQDVPAYLEARRNSRGKTPYWSAPHKDILFANAYGGKGYCADKNSYAVTQSLILPASITLCPLVFSTVRPLGSIAIRAFPSSAINADPNNIPNDALRLSQVLPDSANLFHELFHLILGTDVTYPSLGEEYIITRMAKLSVSDALSNPETFTALATAYWHTLNVPWEDGKPVEFYGYFSTRG